MIFSSPAASSSILNTPTGRPLMIARARSVGCFAMSTSIGSPSLRQRNAARIHSCRDSAGRLQETVDYQPCRRPLSISYLIGSPPIGTSTMTLTSLGRVVTDRDGIKTHSLLRYGCADIVRAADHRNELAP